MSLPGATGLLGGAFDPPHDAHVVLAQTAQARFALERLLVVVTGIPSHKQVVTPGDVRFELARAAFAGHPGIELCRHELDLGEPAYTVDTVRWAASRYGEVVFLVGADEFADFLAWRDPDGVLRSARLGVATRPGFPREHLEPVLARLERPERVELFEIPALATSSTEVRERVQRGEPIAGLVPPRVERLIRELGLYRDRTAAARAPA